MEKYLETRKKLIAKLQDLLERWKVETRDELYDEDLQRVIILEEDDRIYGKKVYYIARGSDFIYRISYEYWKEKMFGFSFILDLQNLDTKILISILENFDKVLEKYEKEIEKRIEKINTLI